MKIILYNNTKIIEEVTDCQNVIINGRNIRWDDGEMTDVKVSFVIVDDDFEADTVDDILVIHLEQKKKTKIAEFVELCGLAILGRFVATVDLVDYQFSNDLEAQSNFKDAMWVLESGMATSVKWTAYNELGNVVRLELDVIKLSEVNISRLMHQLSQVGKLRDILEPQVNACLTVDEVEAIQWDS